MKTAYPVCFFCNHTVDTDNSDYKRIETMESVSYDAPRVYAHELCYAEAEVMYEHDREIEAWLDMFDELSQEEE